MRIPIYAYGQWQNEKYKYVTLSEKLHCINLNIDMNDMPPKFYIILVPSIRFKGNIFN